MDSLVRRTQFFHFPLHARQSPMSVSRNRVHFPRAIRPPFGLWTFGSGYDFKGIINKMKGEVKGGKRKPEKGARKNILATPGLFLIPHLSPWVILMITNKIRIGII